MTFELPVLPFAYDALEPHMSKETFEYHHDKHHAAYVAKGNELLEGSGLEKLPLEEIIMACANDKAKAPDSSEDEVSKEESKQTPDSKTVPAATQPTAAAQGGDSQ